MRLFAFVLLGVLQWGAPAAAQTVQDTEADRFPPAPSVRPGLVAIFPFVNLSQAPADEWLGAGIAETVAAELSTAPGLTVVWHAGDGDARAPDWVIRGAYQRIGTAL